MCLSAFTYLPHRLRAPTAANQVQILLPAASRWCSLWWRPVFLIVSSLPDDGGKRLLAPYQVPVSLRRSVLFLGGHVLFIVMLSCKLTPLRNATTSEAQSVGKLEEAQKEGSILFVPFFLDATARLFRFLPNHDNPH